MDSAVNLIIDTGGIAVGEIDKVAKDSNELEANKSSNAEGQSIELINNISDLETITTDINLLSSTTNDMGEYG